MTEGDNIRKFLKIFLRTIIIILILFLITYIFLYVYAKMSPKLNLNSANVYYLYDSSNELYTGSNDKWVSINDISKYLIDSTISIEDKNFYKHNGFDILRIIKAMFINIKSGKTKQGASTITQQYAKNLFLDFNKTWKRKIDEAWITLRLEAHYTKDELLEGYLNTINYGGIYGIENASYYYFGKSAKELDLAESTILAGIPKSPSNYSPISNYDNAKKRQLLILDSMVKNGYITEEEKTNAYNEELTFIGEVSTNNLKTLMYFQDAVIDELKTIKEIPSSFLTTGGLKIYTTLDMNAQESLEKSIDTNLSYDKDLQVLPMYAGHPAADARCRAASGAGAAGYRFFGAGAAVRPGGGAGAIRGSPGAASAAAGNLSGKRAVGHRLTAGCGVRGADGALQYGVRSLPAARSSGAGTAGLGSERRRPPPDPPGALCGVLRYASPSGRLDGFDGRIKSCCND